MGVMEIVAIIFPTVIGETLNGPMLAGVFTIVGFSATEKPASIQFQFFWEFYLQDIQM